MERIVIMEPGELITRAQLPRAVRGEAELVADLGAGRGSLREARAAFERAYILRTLRELSGNVSAAARALGLERVALFTDRGVAGLEAVASVTSALAGVDGEVVVYDEVRVEPTEA